VKTGSAKNVIETIIAIVAVFALVSLVLILISKHRKKKNAEVFIYALSWRSSFRQYWLLYLMMIPGVLYFLVFKYAPMVGVVMAFKQYSPYSGIAGLFTSEWAGFQWFSRFTNSIYFERLVRNSFVISLKKIIVCFPASIILALMLNSVPNLRFKKSIQTISYLPHFLSMVVICSIVRSLVSVDGGLVNAIIKMFGADPIVFLGSKQHFHSILVISELWRTVGWGSIIYLAAITGIDPNLYEAAKVDGANWHHQIWHITLPGIASIISLMLILRSGDLLDAGFEQIFLLYSSSVYEVADIIDTYVYREGLINLNYSYSTAVNLFKSVIALILVLSSNSFAKRMGQEGIW
jgi:putative aldouronate transport system permease protein